MLAAMAKDSIIYNHDGMELPVDDWKHGEHSFVELTHVIQSTHDAAQTCAVKAINRMQRCAIGSLAIISWSLNSMVKTVLSMVRVFLRSWRKRWNVKV